MGNHANSGGNPVHTETINIQVYRIFGEVHTLTDYLIDTAKSEGRQQFSTFSRLPSMARKILNTDKQ